MRTFVVEPPGAEKPPILPPAASTLWQGMISAYQILLALLRFPLVWGGQLSVMAGVALAAAWSGAAIAAAT
jgi:hypothetical protein